MEFLFLIQVKQYQTSSKTHHVSNIVGQLKDWSQSSMIMVNCSLIWSWITSIRLRQTCPHLSRVAYACIHTNEYMLSKRTAIVHTICFFERKQNIRINIEVTSRHAEYAVVCLMIFEGWYALKDEYIYIKMNKTRHL